jgi:hypothetical protein
MSIGQGGESYWGMGQGYLTDDLTQAVGRLVCYLKCICLHVYIYIYMYILQYMYICEKSIYLHL